MVYNQNAGELLARISRTATVSAATLCVKIRLKVTWRMLRRARSIFCDSFGSFANLVRFCETKHVRVCETVCLIQTMTMPCIVLEQPLLWGLWHAHTTIGLELLAGIGGIVSCLFQTESFW